MGDHEIAPLVAEVLPLLVAHLAVLIALRPINWNEKPASRNLVGSNRVGLLKFLGEFLQDLCFIRREGKKNIFDQAFPLINIDWAFFHHRIQIAHKILGVELGVSIQVDTLTLTGEMSVTGVE